MRMRTSSISWKVFRVSSILLIIKLCNTGTTSGRVDIKVNLMFMRSSCIGTTATRDVNTYRVIMSFYIICLNITDISSAIFIPISIYISHP